VRAGEAVIYIPRWKPHASLCLRRNCHAAGESIGRRKKNIMGDRSPKSTQKKSSQKQARAISDAQKKKAAIASKQAAGKNR
jgi:hypothetical protein